MIFSAAIFFTLTSVYGKPTSGRRRVHWADEKRNGALAQIKVFDPQSIIQPKTSTHLAERIEHNKILAAFAGTGIVITTGLLLDLAIRGNKSLLGQLYLKLFREDGTDSQT